MSYGILEESGETRTLGFAKSENHALILKIARPEYLFSDTMPSPFYFNLWIKPDKSDPNYEHFEDDEWIMLTHDVSVNDLKDFRNKVKKHAKKYGISSVTYNNLRSSVELKAVSDKVNRGTLFRNFEEPEEYFLRAQAAKEKQKIEAVNSLYEFAEQELGSDIPIQQMNKYILERLAVDYGLPTILLHSIPDYSGLNRRLTCDEILDDMENREIMSMTSPVGLDSDEIDGAAKKCNKFTWFLEK